jgi:hypothetical protein
MYSKEDASKIQESNFSPELPELQETAVRHEELEAQYTD